LPLFGAMHSHREEVDLCVVGAGIAGAATFYLASRYGDLSRVALVEKAEDVATVNSRADRNSQTLHIGDIETNYDRDKSREVKRGAELLEAYLSTHDDSDTHRHVPKMALAIGDDEIARLRERYEAYRELYPNLEWLEREAIGEREPLLVEGRPADEPIAAIYNPRGLAVSFERAAETFVERGIEALDEDQALLCFGDGLETIERTRSGYRLTLESGLELHAKALAVNAGGDSLRFAKQLGLAEDWGLVNVAGDWFVSRAKTLSTKVYTMQKPGLPFAAVHGDPEVDDPDQTRFGPSALILPVMEREQPRTAGRFLRSAGLGWRWLVACVTILMSSGQLLRFNLRNLLFVVPWIGRRLFARRIRRIVPSLRVADLEKGRHTGGVRPQVVDLKSREIDFGEKKIHDHEGAGIFVITPSPGASISLASALADVQLLFGEHPELGAFDTRAFLRDIGLEEHLEQIERTPHEPVEALAS
jgi:malate dehydrogenase (quinone)